MYILVPFLDLCQLEFVLCNRIVEVKWNTLTLLDLLESIVFSDFYLYYIFYRSFTDIFHQVRKFLLFSFHSMILLWISVDEFIQALSQTIDTIEFIFLLVCGCKGLH